MEELRVQTHEREAMLDITGTVQKCIRQNGWQNGAVLVYCPHTTGAVTVNEGADPDVVRDVLTHLREAVPHRGDYRHAEGNSDAHIKSGLFGAGQLFIVQGGGLMLGTWQKIFFCEFDGPRTRKLWVQWLGGEK